MATASNFKSKIVGWGSDLDLHNRPGVPKEKNDESVTDVRTTSEYELIPTQIPRVEILVSSEHKKMPPIFGTACPPHGLSGILRRLAFKYSEGRKVHWLVLLLADRFDVIESALSNLLHFRSHNLFKEYGLKSEFRKGGFFSRFGHDRADTKRWGQEIFLELSLIGAGVLIIRRLWRSSDKARR